MLIDGGAWGVPLWFWIWLFRSESKRSSFLFLLLLLSFLVFFCWRQRSAPLVLELAAAAAAVWVGTSLDDKTLHHFRSIQRWTGVVWAGSDKVVWQWPLSPLSPRAAGPTQNLINDPSSGTGHDKRMGILCHFFGMKPMMP